MLLYFFYVFVGSPIRITIHRLLKKKLKQNRNIPHAFIASYAIKLSNHLETLCTFYYAFLLLQYKTQLNCRYPEGNIFFIARMLTYMEYMLKIPLLIPFA